MSDGRIFISYRRGDDSHVTGRLYDRLKQSFGPDRLFMDVDSIPAGIDFVDYLDRQVGQCRAFLAIVGPGWVQTMDRLHNPADFVRIEIEAVLKRPDIPIIPVLVDDTKMPKAEELPEALQQFVRRAGIALPHDHFSTIVDGRLTKTLHEALESPQIAEAPIERPTTFGQTPDDDPVRPPTLEPEVQQSKSKRRWGSIAIAIALPVVVGGTVLYDWLSPETVLTTHGSTKRTPLADLKEGDSFWDCPKCPEMVVIPAGKFRMGSPPDEEGRDEDEGPQRDVTVPGFAMARTEVTFDQWQACVDDGGCASNKTPDDADWGRGPRPVIYVAWNHAQDYIDWLNSKVEGEPYRLPSEAEWEYAVRAGTKGRFSNDKDPKALCEIANHADASMGERWTVARNRECSDRDGDGTSPVASYAANGFGLYDMHGNVWEWIADVYYDKSYQNAPSDASAHVLPDDGERVVRGGSWGDIPKHLRSASRGERDFKLRDKYIGFRPARTLVTP